MLRQKTQRQESWNVEHCNDHLYLLCELTIVAQTFTLVITLLLTLNIKYLKHKMLND